MGRVEAVVDNQVTVRTRRLAFEGSALVLGPEQVETARRSVGVVGRSWSLISSRCIGTGCAISSRRKVWPP